MLDGYGGIHPVPPATTGGPYWNGRDIARGIALNPAGTGGYVLDGYGGIHPFAIGTNPVPPAESTGAYYGGWDVATGGRPRARTPRNACRACCGPPRAQTLTAAGLASTVRRLAQSSVRTCRTIAKPHKWLADELAVQYVEFPELSSQDEARACLCQDPCTAGRICSQQLASGDESSAASQRR